MLTKEDSKMAQGLAILAMVMLHLFCRVDSLPYSVHLYIGGRPLVYYLGLFGDICVPIYCFCSGYAQYILSQKDSEHYSVQRFSRLRKFLLHFALIVLIVSITGLLIGNSAIPGTFETFLGNIFLYRISYNGAWWFVLTYLFLILLSPVFIQILKNSRQYALYFIAFGSGILYFISYCFEIVRPITIANPLLGWFWRQLLLLGRTQFPFFLGMLYCKCNVIAVLRQKLEGRWFRLLLLIFAPLGVFLLHCVVPSMFLAPFTALVTLTCFHLWKKPQWLRKFFLFFGRHSTNIWLVHMFFYSILFPDLVFRAKEPVLVLLFMLALCIAVSYGIDGLEAVFKKLISSFQVSKKVNP